MQIGDTRFVHLVSEQGAIKEQEKKTRAQSDTDERTEDRYAVEEETPRLMDPQKMMSLVRQRSFNMGDVKDRAEELKSAKGFRASEAELRELKRELKAIHGDITRDGWESISPTDRKRLQWVNLAEAGVKDSLEGINSTRKNAQWEKISAEHGGEIPPTYELYFKESNVPVKEMRQILQISDDLHSRDSKMKIGGNSVTPLMRGDIWATKMKMLDNAIKSPEKDGKPVEIDAEYYELASPEMVGRLRAAAQNGAKVRVVLDPGHLQSSGKNTFDATSLAVRAQVVEELTRDEKDMGVALYPNKEQLGGRDEIMHRKIFRVGEEVVFGGMNANPGSGENIDFGMKIEGPAARRIGEEFRQDAETSTGKSVEQIYGSQLDTIRSDETTVKLTGWGVEGMLSAAYAGKAGLLGTEGKEERVDKLIAAAKAEGVDVAALGDFSDSNKDGKVSPGDVRSYILSRGHKTVDLTASGKEFLASQIEASIDRINGDKNKEALQDVTPPKGDLSGGSKGKDVLAVGSSSVERQALVLDAISSAEKQIKISAFVLNDDISKLLIEKKREKEARGEDFKVQVIMDPGTYGFGGSPNEAAYKRLEDAGIEVKWSLLERTDPDHDRKNHSKLIMTDKLLLTGSTNFSAKGLRNNWEVNDIVYFNENDPDSIKKQQTVEADYDRMWRYEAIDINTRALAEKKYSSYTGDDKAIKIDRYRNTILRTFGQKIEAYEKEMGGQISQIGARSEMRDDIEKRVLAGENSGFALLSSIPREELDRMRMNVPAWKSLQEMRAGRWN